MRFVVLGAGAVGGVVGGRLAEHGHDVQVIARGAHREAMASRGLRVDSPDGSVALPVRVHGVPGDVEWTGAEAVLLGVKSQDTAGVLDALMEVAPPDTPVVCLQNGVANEREALRRFANVYGICVMCPATHLEPGVVMAHSAPVTALLDIGRYPSGADDVCRAVASALAASGMESEVRPDIMRWKHTKLLMNLGNAIGALCGPEARGGPLNDLVRSEGVACLEAAGIPFASVEEDRARRGDKLRMAPAAGERWRGDSSWQSLARSTGAIETAYLNGEVVLLGRLHGVATPANELLVRLALQAAREHRAPGSVDPDELLAHLGAAPA
ncbi:MAG TPA: 2-dehydropantoate 2-reductase N-terminal domain-containing protein [Acidimicrobiales bacterium]|nr:2-dehydropantoate 2-reductase N-terminal domain-containing protein [Acidimicrobiales bacterium]